MTLRIPLMQSSLARAQRRLRLGVVVAAAAGLGAASALLDACKSLVADSPPEGATPATPPVEVPAVAPVPFEAGTSGEDASVDPGPDASLVSLPEAPSDSATRPQGKWHRDASVDARRGRPQQSNVIYE